MRLLQSKYSQPLIGIGFDAEGQRLVAGGTKGYESWLIATDQSSFVPVKGTNHIFAFVVDPKGRWLYYSASGLGCQIHSLTDASIQMLPGLDHHVIDVATSLDGERIALSRGGMGRNRLKYWSIDEGDHFHLTWNVPLKATSNPFDGPGVSFRPISFRPDGAQMATVETPDQFNRFREHYFIVLRDTATGSKQAEFGSLPHPLFLQMQFTPDGKGLILWDKGVLSLWSVAAQKEAAMVMHPRRTNVQGLAIHPSGQFFLTVANDGLARYWDLATFKVTHSMNCKIGKLLSVAITADGMLAAAGGENGQVVLWDIDL
jgi:WD40 repeat protein